MAYEFAKVASFFLVLPEGSGRKTAIQEYFELFDFSESAMEIFNVIFEKGSSRVL